MKITFDELNKGKEIVHKGITYYAPKDYLKSFFNTFGTNDIKIEVQYPEYVSVTNNTNDPVFNRVWCQVSTQDYVVGISYGIDIKNPCIKVYKGFVDDNSIFVFDKLFYYDLEKDINFTKVKEYTPSNKIDLLKNKKVSYKDKMLGSWIINSIHKCITSTKGVVKISTNSIIDTYKLLYENGAKPETMYDVYKMFSYVIREKEKRDITNKGEKLLLINSIINCGT